MTCPYCKEEAGSIGWELEWLAWCESCSKIIEGQEDA